MIGIGRNYVVRDVFLSGKDVGGIAVPDISQEAPGYIQILNQGLCHGKIETHVKNLQTLVVADDEILGQGEAAITTRDKANLSITISNLPRIIVVHEDRIVASVEEEIEIPYEIAKILCCPNFLIHTNLLPKDKKIRALGDKVVIFPDKSRDFRKYGDILIPNFKDHETLRSHTGIVAAVTKKTAEISGLKVGMRVYYDYWSPFSHDTDYHITKLENLIGVLNEHEESLMGLAQ